MIRRRNLWTILLVIVIVMSCAVFAFLVAMSVATFVTMQQKKRNASKSDNIGPFGGNGGTASKRKEKGRSDGRKQGAGKSDSNGDVRRAAPGAVKKADKPSAAGGGGTGPRPSGGTAGGQQHDGSAGGGNPWSSGDAEREERAAADQAAKEAAAKQAADDAAARDAATQRLASEQAANEAAAKKAVNEAAAGKAAEEAAAKKAASEQAANEAAANQAAKRAAAKAGDAAPRSSVGTGTREDPNPAAGGAGGGKSSGGGQGVFRLFLAPNKKSQLSKLKPFRNDHHIKFWKGFHITIGGYGQGVNEKMANEIAQHLSQKGKDADNPALWSIRGSSGVELSGDMMVLLLDDKDLIFQRAAEIMQSAGWPQDAIKRSRLHVTLGDAQNLTKEQIDEFVGILTNKEDPIEWEWVVVAQYGGANSDDVVWGAHYPAYQL